MTVSNFRKKLWQKKYILGMRVDDETKWYFFEKMIKEFCYCENFDFFVQSDDSIIIMFFFFRCTINKKSIFFIFFL